MIEVSLVTLFILFLVLLFILVSLFFYLIVRKYIKNQLRQEIDKKKEDNRLEVFHFLQTGNPGLLGENLGEEKLEALIELFSDYSNVLESAVVKERIRNFAKQYFTNYIKNKLKQKRWSLRMNALFAIEDFHMDHLGGQLHELFQRSRTTIPEKVQILKLLAIFNDLKIVSFIKAFSQNISDFSLLSIIFNLNEEKIDELIANFEELPSRMQYILVDTIGKKQLTKYQHLLLKLASQDEIELKIRSLKAFAHSGIPIEGDFIEGYFYSDNWQLRMMVAKVVGVQRIDHYKEGLIKLLSDREYIVRAEAAKAILRFKDGEIILKRVTEESKDVFAKDMAIEWLEKERDGYSY